MTCGKAAARDRPRRPKRELENCILFVWLVVCLSEKVNVVFEKKERETVAVANVVNRWMILGIGGI